MKGIVLAAGAGTRLYPLTTATSKPLLPVYDKPMIYYPVSLLMMAGIRDIMLIVSPKDIDSYRKVFGDGADLGINIEYGIQQDPKGIAEALIIADEFTKGDTCALVLGDNLLIGSDVESKLKAAAKTADDEDHATVFGYYVDDPRAFGVVGFDESGKPNSLEEKPEHPASNYCVIGVYFYNGRAAEIAKGLTPSARGELEITDVNRSYLDSGELELQVLDKDTKWFDAGTFDSLAESTNYIKELESTTGEIAACLEEISFRNGWIDMGELRKLGEKMSKSPYGAHLIDISDDQE